MADDIKRKILIVDDVAQNRIILSEILKDEYTIVEADDGDTCLEKLREDKDIVLVLLDLIMQRVSGFDVLEEMSHDKELRNKSVIVTTGDIGSEVEVKALLAGAIDFLEKPYNPSVVRSRVNNVVNHVVVENEIFESELSRANKQLSTIMNLIPDGIAVFEYSGDNLITITHCNEYFLEMFNNEQFLGDTDKLKFSGIDEILKYIYADDRADVKEKILSCINEQLPVTCRYRIVAGKTLKWVRMSMIAPVRIGDNYRYHVLFADISSEMEKEEQITCALNELRYITRHDQLTQLYKRSTFCSRTEKLLKQNPDTKYTIAIFDIKNFKAVNELFGSKTGDDILILIAKCLKKIVGDNGTYGRLESDKFVICIPEKMSDIHSMISEIDDMINKADVLDYNLKIFAGVYYVGNEDIPVEQMCDRANMAANNAKRDYVSRVSYYDSKMRQALMEEEAIISEMENALKTGQFKLCYQPIFSIKTGKPISAEALVRWIHPVNGIVPPNKFITIFENNKFITLLDWYVLEEVCRFQRKRMLAGKRMIPISVNFSRLDCYKPMICDNVLAMVKSYGLKPEYIKIEITETAYTMDKEQIVSVTDKFRNFGFQVLMDDFGSGYSSLNILKDVNLDILKIDKKFIDDIECSNKGGAIVSSVVNMARQIGMDVIAEGVENQLQLDFLKEIGCDIIQGYYYSKPLFEDDFNKIVDL